MDTEKPSEIVNNIINKIHYMKRYDNQIYNMYCSKMHNIFGTLTFNIVSDTKYYDDHIKKQMLECLKRHCYGDLLISQVKLIIDDNQASFPESLRNYLITIGNHMNLKNKLKNEIFSEHNTQNDTLICIRFITLFTQIYSKWDENNRNYFNEINNVLSKYGYKIREKKYMATAGYLEEIMRIPQNILNSDITDKYIDLHKLIYYLEKKI